MATCCTWVRALPIWSRVHGAFVSDQEVHRVVNHLRKQGKPAYLEGILDGPEAKSPADFHDANGLAGT